MARIRFILGFSSVFLALALLWFHSLNSAINVPTFHLDGAFQTASGLFRIDSGQAPGRDFFPYLGVGPLLLIYPIYKIFGGGLAAGVFSAQFVTIALGWISVSVLWQLIFRPKMAIFSLVGGALIFVVPLLAESQLSIPNIFAFAIEPGNSLRPIRAAAPYLVAIASLFLINHIKRRAQRNIIFSMLIAVTMLWSNDFAIPTAGLFAIFFCAYVYFKENATWKKSVITLGLTVPLSWTILISLITVGHPVELIKYNFIDVAKDQWWLFRPYGPSTRIFEFGQIPRLVSRENHFPLIALTIASIVAIKTRKIEHILVGWIGLTLFAGGALASLGGHLGGYFGAFYFWGVTATILAFLRVAQIFAQNHIALSPGGAIAFQAGSISLVFVFLLFGTSLKLISYKENLAIAKNDPARFYVAELGGYIGAEWKDYVSYARQNKDRKVIEEYWGVWSSLNRNFPSWPVDSVIHALGRVRNVAKSGLADADLIISTRYATAPEWQPWNLSQNFWFYDELLSSWEPDFVSPTTIVWRKVGEPRETKEIGCHVSSEKTGFILESESNGFYKVTLNYNSSGAGRYLLMIKNNISFGADSGGYLSLSPNQSSASFPALITKESGNAFDSKVVGSNAVYFSIKSCTATKLLYEHNDVLHLRQPEDFFLTDGNWIHGIARNHAGYFVQNNHENRVEHVRGALIVFKNGESRRVTEVVENGQFLNVDVEGPVLNPADVGRPDEFRRNE